MAKLTRNQIIAGILLIGIAIYFIFPNTLSISGGFSSIGACTQPSFSSTDPFYNNATYACTFVVSGGSQVLNFQLNQNTSSYFGNTTVENPVSFSGALISDNCRYQADARTTYPIYNYVTGYTGTQGLFAWDSYGGGWGCNTAGYNTNGPSFLGTTPIVCNNNNCNINARPPIGGCVPAWRNVVGTIVYLDPSVVYDPQVQLNTTLYGSQGQVTETYTNYISNQNRTYMNPVTRGNIPGSLQGAQSCPASPNVAIFVPSSGSPSLTYVSRDLAQSLVTLGYSLSDPTSIVNQASNYQTRYNQMLSTTPNFGQLCQITTTGNQTYQTAAISCSPTTPASIPVLNIYFNGQSAGLHVASGMPQIVSVSTNTTTQGGQITVVNVQTTNLANEADTFEATLTCPQNIQPFSTSATIGAGQTQIIPINYEGSGFISTCNVEVHSINSPQNNAESSIRISIEPFCGRTALNPSMQRVGTQYGCQFICPNYYGTTDVRDSDCGVITSYDRCTSRNASGVCTSDTYTNYVGFHCTGIGTYQSMNNYLDAAFNSNNATVFIPQVYQNKYFITSDGTSPICNYVNAYGYDDQGNQLSSLTFNPAIGPPLATQSSTPTLAPPTTPLAPPGSTPVPNTTTTTTVTPPSTPTTPTTPNLGNQPLSQNTILLVIGGIAILGAIYWYVYKR